MVKFLAIISMITGESSIELLCTPHDTTDTVMQTLVENFGLNFKQAIMNGTNLKSGIKMIVNGRDIDYLNGLDTQLNDGDVVVIIPPIAGGPRPRHCRTVSPRYPKRCIGYLSSRFNESQ